MKILHLEDSPADAELVSTLLAEEWPHCAIDMVSTRSGFVSKLESSRYDVILSDFDLQSFNGLEALRIARHRTPDAPFIFVSGTLGEEAAIEAVRAGAQDYVLKDQIRRLVAAIPRAIREAEERRARRDVEQAHLRLVSIFESTPDLVGMIGLDGRTFYVNPAGLRLLGLPPLHDARQLTLRDFYPPEIWSLIEKEAMPAALRDGTWAGETSLRAGARTVPVSQVIIAHKMPDGSVQYLSTIVRDLTATKVAEKRIREQADLINRAREAIIVSDPEGRLTFWNQGAERITGWLAAEVMGRTLETVFGDKFESQFRSWRTAVETTDEWRGELQLVTKKGQPLVLEGSTTLIRDDHEKTTAWLSIVSDITDQKKLQEQFLRAQRMESIGMLAAGIAHDLNNVLAPILMAAPMLRERASDPSDLRMLETLEKSAERGAGLVRQILSFAQGNDGGRQLVQVKHLMRDICAMIRETFPKRIRLEENIPPAPWPVNANPTQIHQVLLNLCVNARDAMPGEGTLRVRLEHCVLDERGASGIEGARPGAWVVLHIEDTGTGIRPEVLAHVWEPFFTTKAADKGTGLGLSTVRGIVENHGGFVTLASVPDRGTTFRVYLPAAESDPKQSTGRSSQPFLNRGAGELILIADDEVHIRDVTAATLARHGYRVLLAGDGTEAVALFAPRSSDVHLVITDIGMPNLDGAAFAGIVRHLNPRVKILAISGQPVASTGAQPKHFADAFLMKPFKAASLLSAVHQLLHPPVTETAAGR
jgi:two-component system cell cycle sensor histidine kinase/response regulator CckA